MHSIDRRTVVAGLAGTLPAAALGGASVFSSPALAQLIERHRAAYQAFCKAVDTYDNDVDDRMNPAYDAALDAEYDALFELFSYRCQSIEEASVKAAYLLTTADVRDEELLPEHVTALLQSFVPPAA